MNFEPVAVIYKLPAIPTPEAERSRTGKTRGPTRVSSIGI